MTDELIIDEFNFNQYFFDIKKYGPKKGQILARYAAIGELTEKFPKGAVVDILAHNPQGYELAPKVLRNICHVKDALKVSIEMAGDLANGISIQEVTAKPYKVNIEMFFWTNREFIPKDDPHWNCIEVVNCTEKDESAVNTLEE